MNVVLPPAPLSSFAIPSTLTYTLLPPSTTETEIFVALEFAMIFSNVMSALPLAVVTVIELGAAVNLAAGAPTGVMVTGTAVT